LSLPGPARLPGRGGAHGFGDFTFPPATSFIACDPPGGIRDSAFSPYRRYHCIFSVDVAFLLANAQRFWSRNYPHPLRVNMSDPAEEASCTYRTKAFWSSSWLALLLVGWLAK
jgi:hypothetical protein